VHIFIHGEVVTNIIKILYDWQLYVVLLIIFLMLGIMIGVIVYAYGEVRKMREKY